MKQSMLDKVLKYDVVSFDLFDTLITRDVYNPHEVFVYMEGVLRKKYGAKYQGFAQKRIEAERIAYKRRKEDDIQLHDIYQVYAARYGTIDSDLQGLEVQCELDLTTTRWDLFQIYEMCVRQGKCIVLISDMYLPRSAVMALLEKNAIRSYDVLYLSGETGRSKRTGNLFRHVQSEQNIDRKIWLHIGDNFVSDYLQARRIGIHALHVPRETNFISLCISSRKARIPISLKNLVSFLNHRILTQENCYQKIGYALFGPVLYGVAAWLAQEAKAHQIEKIFFFARDGYLFQKAYENMVGGVPSTYFLVSRKSMLLPFLATKPSYDLFYLTVIQGFPSSFSVRAFFEKLQLPWNEERLSFLSAFGYTEKSIFQPCELEHDTCFQQMYWNILEEFSAEIQSAAQSFQAYLAECGLQKGERIGVFDIGWRGTIQFLLERILETPLYGYYLFADKSIFNLVHMQAFIAEGKRAVYENAGYSSLLELVFSAPHGSVQSYCMENGRVRAVCSAYEHEGKEESQALEHLREGALTCCKALSMHPLYREKTGRDLAYVALLRQAGECPSMWLVRAFNVFHFEDGERLPLIGGQPVWQYMRHPVLFVKDFLASSWKIGFLKKYFYLPLGPVFLYIKNAILFSRMRQ